MVAPPKKRLETNAQPVATGNRQALLEANIHLHDNKMECGKMLIPL